MGRKSRRERRKSFFDQSVETVTEMEALVRYAENAESSIPKKIAAVNERIEKLLEDRAELEERLRRAPIILQQTKDRLAVLKSQVTAMAREREIDGVDKMGRCTYTETRVEKILRLRKELEALEANS